MRNTFLPAGPLGEVQKKNLYFSRVGNNICEHSTKLKKIFETKVRLYLTSREKARICENRPYIGKRFRSSPQRTDKILLLSRETVQGIFFLTP